MDYKLFRPTYTVDGETRTSDTYHVRFRDHRRKRQTMAGETRENETHTLARYLMELVRCRRDGDTPSQKLRAWLDNLDDNRTARLVKMDLIDSADGIARPLKLHLNGETDAGGAIVRPGFKQELAASGVETKYLNLTVQRIETILAKCGFNLWSDLKRPGAAGEVQVYLGGQRDAKAIVGTTFNYYVRDFNRFCRWIAERLGRDVPLKLTRVDNAQADAEMRRSLSTDEMQHLIDTAASEPTRFSLTGEERALVYRFAFEAGIRPGQMRALTVAHFDLTSDTPNVRTQARFVKRRKEHTQAINPDLAATLARWFKSKLPAAAAFKLPSRYHMARMFQKDLLAARTKWIDAKGLTDEQREERQRSDFLALENHQGERAVFYSLRHSHGTALAAAGVPEKDIAASMHHASRTTTVRYLHSDRAAVRAAVATLPSITPTKQRATGTDGKPVENPNPLRKPCAARYTPVDSSGQIDGEAKNANRGKSPKNREISAPGGNRTHTGISSQRILSP